MNFSCNQLCVFNINNIGIFEFDCVKSVSMELNVKGKYYNMLLYVSNAVSVKDINSHGIIFWDIVWALKRARIFGFGETA